MRKPGKGDTLIKIGSLGGGGLGVVKSWSDTARNTEKNKKELQKLKDSEGAWKKFVADNERKKKKIREMDKSAAKKKMEKTVKCPKCGGKGCSHCSGTGMHKRKGK